MNCKICHQSPSESDVALIEAASTVVQPTSWLCAGCRPPGFPADGLCYGVVEIGGESPQHEYES